MKPIADQLPDDLIWSEGGHLSDIAIAALGDGQDEILPEKARDHAVSCEACAAQMGHAAMLSSELGAVMRAPIPKPITERAPVPWLAILAAMLVAAFGSLSSIFENPSTLAESPNALLRQSSLAFHAVSAVVRGVMNGLGPMVSFGCAALLFATGAFVARSMPRAWAE